MTFADIARAQMEEARVCECPQPDLRKTCCARNYLRGAFLRVGTVSAGQTGYHMEFSAENLRESTKIRGVLQRFGVKCGETARNKRIGVYVKGEADIAEVLSLCGADGARLQLEETAAARNMNSATQRRVNCDTANAGRTAAASQRVIAAIEALQRKGIALPRPLADAALARQERPDDTIAELAAYLGITKRALHARLKRIEENMDQ